MKRMLINATQSEEIRVAIVDDHHLEDLDIENPHREQKKSNIYKGVITRIEPSLEAAFVEYGSLRHGFLPFKEIVPGYLGGASESPTTISIKDRIHVGQELIVQIEREERGQKGAALTTYISLAGRFIVLSPNNPESTGVSRRVEGDERDEIRSAIASLQVPEGMGVICRTASVGRTPEELKWDLDYLLQLWKAIFQAAEEKKAPFLIYQESNLIIRIFRDYLRRDIAEVLIDDLSFYENARDFVQLVIPQHGNIIQYYESDIPLFTHFKIEEDVERIFHPEVRLPSGGAIIIHHTEALVSIDVNSSKATQGSDIEETALNTNVEATIEIARQLRLRDIGGLIVIDFIDMLSGDNQKRVENSLWEAFKGDRARVQIGRISRFGLLEMSRQRLRSSISESLLVPCSHCKGSGKIRDTVSFAIALLRTIESKAALENMPRIEVRCPPDVATYLLNEERRRLQAIAEKRHTEISILPLSHLQVPQYEIKTLAETESSLKSLEKAHELANASLSERAGAGRQLTKPKEIPAVSIVKSAMERPHKGLLKKLYSTFFGAEQASKAHEQTPLVEKSTPDKKPYFSNRRPSGRRMDKGGSGPRGGGYRHRRPEGGGHRHYGYRKKD
ncbi:MAG: Rne/Rng family ribonuclease [Gammaproteobacteria bacterium]|nr:Rne/Rng family ribonuclease [Gammaproteobacteria bacterium]